MKYSLEKRFITGTVIPVSALKTEDSIGIGEFLDLKLFADWCKSVGLDLIQLLPVNDTGFQSSPYSALSAFALHPVYISIKKMPEAKKYKSDLEKISKKWEGKDRVHFNSVLKDKLKLLKKIYKDNYEKIEKSRSISKWEKDNPWIKSYAIFSFLKEKNKNLEWMDWEEFKDPSKDDIENLYIKNRKKTLFYSWVQYYLEKQLQEATLYMDSLGINLKGDLPILMNIDSADVWESRDIFNVKNRAGAPPDMFSEEGQNWGFPTYSWDSMEEDNFFWWKARLKQAAKFYHAYRIDHVLGFFRIWTIPPQYISGSMGYYSPNDFLHIDDLKRIGIDGPRLAWMSKPHIPGYELRDKLGFESNEATKLLLDQINTEDLYLFKDEVKSVHDIYAVEELSDEAKSELVNFYRNVTLIKVDEYNYATTWFYYNSRAYISMNDHEKYEFGQLQSSKSGHSMWLWENQGLKLLKFMKESEDMLVCAEDLGTIPNCVPKVLEELGILGLHVTRWSKKYNEYGEPFMKPSEYNYLSVSTPAVHDSSTVRQWWPEMSSNDEISNALNLDNKLSPIPDTDQVKKLYEALLKTSAKIAMFQFQDLLAINESLRSKNAETERINVPGTTNDVNWSYRLSFNLEDLIKMDEFNNELKEMIKKRG
ncbi:4-alpha-glucanotransferase [Thiospirochaeta perfilievii]|uniref:4-alpha-glucanotransferase n=1 Tax=Thiospirochaeta perfilievii TaxID=252967 RepID=UPI0016593368|nr:4-alpha-glucanotransferase [Thiospirochaeta perfilievii]